GGGEGVAGVRGGLGVPFPPGGGARNNAHPPPPPPPLFFLKKAGCPPPPAGGGGGGGGWACTHESCCMPPPCPSPVNGGGDAGADRAEFAERRGALARPPTPAGGRSGCRRRSGIAARAVWLRQRRRRIAASFCP